MSPRLVAFYLPQFYPSTENDHWWGKGFTEWTNVARARPLFRGHYQPHLPADLGFYDLRLPETRVAQAQLAATGSATGTTGSTGGACSSARSTRSSPPASRSCRSAWRGRTRHGRAAGQLLMKQLYSPKADLNHIRWLITAFADPRYIRVAGRPLFVVYRPRDLPDPKRTTDVLLAECLLPDPYLLGSDAHCPGVDCRRLGFDSTLVFEPQLSALADRFADGLRDIVRSVASRPSEEQLVFLNAWNEWAEDNHLEPDQRYGHGHLEAVKASSASRRVPTVRAGRRSPREVYVLVFTESARTQRHAIKSARQAS